MCLGSLDMFIAHVSALTKRKRSQLPTPKTGFPASLPPDTCTQRGQCSQNAASLTRRLQPTSTDSTGHRTDLPRTLRAGPRPVPTAVWPYFVQGKRSIAALGLHVAKEKALMASATIPRSIEASETTIFCSTWADQRELHVLTAANVSLPSKVLA